MDNGPGQERLHKQRLVKSARMYAMCQKAEMPDPELQVSLALAAFEEMPLPEATAFVRTNRPNLEDMAWALRNSDSAEEFEEKLRERVAAMSRGQAGGRRSPPPGAGGTR
ncbi:MAG: hypothetical protein H0U65_07260 [Rubrobacter sp.]|nr:hypothetical protein [Rubrobacter sp.]